MANMHPLLKRQRFEVIAMYPESKFFTGQVIDDENTDIYMEKYPLVFREMKWWESLTVDELLSIKYVEILEDKIPGCHQPMVLGIKLKLGSQNSRIDNARFSFVVGDQQEIHPCYTKPIIL